MANKIRVGMVGITPNRGFSSIAHMPALLALSEFEVVAVCTTKQTTAEIAARHYGATHAFADPVKLAQHPDVDMVTVCVSVPGHLDPVMAAIDAGKHVYSEWPLGRTTAEALKMRDAATAKGVRHAVGLQGRVSPSICYVRDLIAAGHIGQPQSAALFVNAGNWGATIDRAYQTSFANGANLMTITGGHNLDALCFMLGEFTELSAFAVSQRDTIPLEGTGEPVPKDVPDQLVVSGILGSGAVVSVQVRGGMTRGHEFLCEIHGSEGDIVLEATERASTQRQELRILAARGKGVPLAEMPVPDRYRWVDAGVPKGSPYNVAQLYARFAESIRSGKPMHPSFDDAIVRHRMLDAIVAASSTGQKQRIGE